MSASCFIPGAILLTSPFAIYSWTDTHFLMADGNFRLKHKDRNLVGKPLGDGWAYFVGQEDYMSHIEKCGPQTEVSALTDLS